MSARWTVTWLGLVLVALTLIALVPFFHNEDKANCREINKTRQAVRLAVFAAADARRTSAALHPNTLRAIAELNQAAEYDQQARSLPNVEC